MPSSSRATDGICWHRPSRATSRAGSVLDTASRYWPTKSYVTTPSEVDRCSPSIEKPSPPAAM
eukprot:6099908-Prymnesium_polylepis.1